MGCITSQAEAQQGRQSEKDVAASCSAELCNQAPTFQNIMKNFCQADFVAKIKFKKTQRKRFKNPNCIWRQTMNAARIGSRAIPKRQDFWSWGKSQKIKVKVWCQLSSFLGQEIKK